MVEWTTASRKPEAHAAQGVLRHEGALIGASAVEGQSCGALSALTVAVGASWRRTGAQELEDVDALGAEREREPSGVRSASLAHHEALSKAGPARAASTELRKATRGADDAASTAKSNLGLPVTELDAQRWL